MITLDEVDAIIDQMQEPVLSLFVNIDNAADTNQAVNAGWRIWLKDEIKRLAAQGQNSSDPVWQQIAEAAERYVMSDKPTGKSVAVFIGADETRELMLTMPIDNRVMFGKPFVIPLLWLIDEYEPYLIVLVDQEKTSILTVSIGQMGGEDRLKIDTDDYDFGERSDRQLGAFGQGNSRDLFEKTIDEHRNRYFRDVVARIEHLSHDKHSTRILFGGSEESAKAVIGMLPKRLADQVVGWHAIPINSDPKTIIDRALPAALDYERQREMQIVTEVIDLAKSRGRGALGSRDVMLALEEQRVELLVIPYPIADDALAADLPHKVRASSGSIEFVFGEAAERLNAEGGIGARLYYAIPSAGNTVPTEKGGS